MSFMVASGRGFVQYMSSPANAELIADIERRSLLVDTRNESLCHSLIGVSRAMKNTMRALSSTDVVVANNPRFCSNQLILNRESGRNVEVVTFKERYQSESHSK
jgi:S-adenosylmethionine:tRNA-ribosyltransferase-isomerase (queuine synthetase)